MTMTFIADFTGQLSKVNGFALPGTQLRVEKGHEYRIEVDDRTRHGRLTDMTLTMADMARELQGGAHG